MNITFLLTSSNVAKVTKCNEINLSMEKFKAIFLPRLRVNFNLFLNLKLWARFCMSFRLPFTVTLSLILPGVWGGGQADPPQWFSFHNF